ncbi:MAG: hypothetical protein Q7J16_08785, partial [Candidatus Cloacimonadales bacterium]|nr:hypothetical protein [Candidatus Cloacimonadales bacterium]
PVSFYHLRTLDGKEVDLLLECNEGFVDLECKMARRIVPADFRAIKSLLAILDKPLLAGFVICLEDSIQRWEGDIPLYSVPAAWLLS